MSNSLEIDVLGSPICPRQNYLLSLMKLPPQIIFFVVSPLHTSSDNSHLLLSRQTQRNQSNNSHQNMQGDNTESPASTGLLGNIRAQSARKRNDGTDSNYMDIANNGGRLYPSQKILLTLIGATFSFLLWKGLFGR